MDVYDKETGTLIEDESSFLRCTEEYLSPNPDEQISHWRRDIPLRLAALTELAAFVVGGYVARESGGPTAVAVFTGMTLAAFAIANSAATHNDAVLDFNLILSHYGFPELDYARIRTKNY